MGIRLHLAAVGWVWSLVIMSPSSNTRNRRTIDPLERPTLFCLEFHTFCPDVRTVIYVKAYSNVTFSKVQCALNHLMTPPRVSLLHSSRSPLNFRQAWASESMGKRGGGTCPSEKVLKCFAALVITVKCSVDELFTHYF